jgi:terminal uridylyltransferase
VLVPPQAIFQAHGGAIIRALDAAVVAAAGEWMMSDEERHRRRMLVQKLGKQVLGACKAAGHSWASTEGAALQLFGSSANGFGTAASDLDLCLVLPNVPLRDDHSKAAPTGTVARTSVVHMREESTGPTRAEVVEALAAALQVEGFSDVSCRATARVPIVTFHHAEIGLDCDICVENKLALANTHLLRTLRDTTPHLRTLAAVVKRWASARGINSPGKGTLSSYGYILALWKFMQMQRTPAAPCLQCIPPTWRPHDPVCAPLDRDTASRMPLHTEPNAEGSACPTYFYQPPSEGHAEALRAQVSTHHSPAALLLSWLWWLGAEYDGSCHIISPGLQFHGDSVVPSGDPGPARATGPMASRPYKETFYGWYRTPVIGIEDPFEVSYNVAHVVRPYGWRRIRLECMRAYAGLVSGALAALHAGAMPEHMSGDEAKALLAPVLHTAPVMDSPTREEGK